MSRHRRFRFSRAAAAGAAALAACLALSAGSVSAQERTFIFGSVATPTAFDTEVWLPGSLESAVNVYENLFAYATLTDADGRTVVDASRVVPHLAESFDISPDGKVITVKIRRGVKSPYGNELVADFIKKSWDMAAARKKVSNFMINVGRLDHVEVVDDYTVKFHLSVGNRVFPRVLTTLWAPVVDWKEAGRHATDDDPWSVKFIERNTAGFGAYHVQSVQPGQGAVFTVNPNYFGKKPYFTRVLYREIPSAASRAALVKSGEIHWADQMPIQQLVDLKKDPNVKVESVPGTGSATVVMNHNFEPFGDVRVRKAIAYATDYGAIGDVVFRGLGERSRSLLSPSYGEAHIESYHYDTDLDKARALLREAGHADGLNITIEYSDSWWWEEPLVIQMKDSLAKVGIDVTPKHIPKTELLSRRRIGNRTLPMFPHLANAFVLDPAYSLFLQAHTKGSSDVGDYDNPRFDAVVDQMIGEQDPKTWLAIVHEAQTLHSEDVGLIDTFYPKTYGVMVPCISGWLWRPHDRLVWRELRCEEG